MNEPAVVTTIVPTYERPQLVRRAIRSVLAQDYPHVQLRVYDNSESDDTEAIVTEMARHDARVRYQRHARNVGYLNNIIYGMQRVESTFFSVLSDDDVLTPWFYERALQGFTCYPTAMLSAMDSIKVSSANTVLAGPLWKLDGECRFFEPDRGFAGMIGGEIPFPWVGTLFRREVIQKIGLPNPAAGPHINDNFILHAVARFPCVVTPGVGCLVTEGASSVGAQMRALNGEWVQWWGTVIRDILEDSELSPSIRRAVEQIATFDYRRVAWQHVVQGLGRFGLRGPEYAHQAAIGVGECGFPLTSLILRAVVWGYNHLVPMRVLFDKLAQRRKSMTAQQRERLTSQYRELCDYLLALGTDAPLATTLISRASAI